MSEQNVSEVTCTLPFVPISVDGRELKLCFDYDALELAERKIRAAGNGDVYLIFAMYQSDITSIRTMFAAALQPYQPEINFEDARKLVTKKNQLEVWSLIRKAVDEAMPEQDGGSSANPPDAPGQ